MDTVYMWETIITVAAVVAIGGPIVVCFLAFKWIVKTYFPKDDK